MLVKSTSTTVKSILHEAGLLVDVVHFDGSIHRVPTIDKPTQKDGSYIAYADAPISIWWKNWRSGKSGTWTAKRETILTVGERKKLHQRIEDSKKLQEAEQTNRYIEASKKAKIIYNSARECDEHFYLTTKKVRTSNRLKISKNGELLVPLYDENNVIVSLQFIDKEGNKRFLTGGKKKGCFFPISMEHSNTYLLIVEGLATGLSLHECTSHTVFVAFDAGNLLSVAELARRLYPDCTIVLCADNDIKEDNASNIGIEKATEAALAINGYLAIPRFNGMKIDWNDLHVKMGIGEVQNQFMCYSRPDGLPSSNTSDKLPPGFSLRMKGCLPGLWHIEVKDDGHPVETWIGPPLYIEGITRDEYGKSWGILLRWEDLDKRTHTWAMPKALLENKDSSIWRGRLADEGWGGSPRSRARKLLAEYLAMYKTERRVLCVPRTGWYKNCFVFPDEVIGKPSGKVGQAGQVYSNNNIETSINGIKQLDELDGEQVVLQVQTPYNPFLQAGTLENWQSTIGQCSKGNSRLILAICASLAAPLLEITGQESGGFNWVGHSSIGKTTSLIVAGSIWGKGSSSGGYVQNWRATSNGLEGLASLHSDTALCLDEIGQAPGRTVMEASYMLANGMGKARAFQDGSAKIVRTWRCMILSTGEKGLEEKIVEEGGKTQAGQTVRLIDIPADSGAGLGLFEVLHGHSSAQAFAEAIKQAAITNYGHMARTFIRLIQKNRQHIQNKLFSPLEKVTKVLCPTNVSGQVRRVARRFALCAVTGELAIQWRLLPWEKGEAFRAIKICFDAWLTARGGSGDAEDTAILEQVMLFLEQHGASRFQDIGNASATVINRVGFRRTVANGTEFLILPESFKSEICKGYNHIRTARLLLKKGILLQGDCGFTRRPPVELPGLGRKRCYTLFISSEDCTNTFEESRPVRPVRKNAPGQSESLVVVSLSSSSGLSSQKSDMEKDEETSSIDVTYYVDIEKSESIKPNDTASSRCVTCPSWRMSSNSSWWSGKCIRSGQQVPIQSRCLFLDEENITLSTQ